MCTGGIRHDPISLSGENLGARLCKRICHESPGVRADKRLRDVDLEGRTLKRLALEDAEKKGLNAFRSAPFRFSVFFL